MLRCTSQVLAHSDALRQRSTSVAFGAKRTLTKLRCQTRRRSKAHAEAARLGVWPRLRLHLFADNDQAGREVVERAVARYCHDEARG